MFRISYDEFWKRVRAYQQDQQTDGRNYAIERAVGDFGSTLVTRLQNGAISRLIGEFGHRTDLTNLQFRALLLAERDRRAGRAQAAILFLAFATFVATCFGVYLTLTSGGS